MVDWLEGIVQTVDEQRITICVASVGLGINVANGTSFTLGNTVALYIHLVWNQENGPALYGFSTPLDRIVFMMVTNCVGVGPKLGLAILGKLGPRGFLQAVQSGDEDALSSVSGIGAKRAEQIIVHCKHKVHKLIASGIEYTDSQQLSQWYELDQALSSLHYSRTEINRALDYLRTELSCNTTVQFDQMFRKALSYLALKQ